ncbi:hypothetical protein L596_026711 [Steinernema carpocapsae]|uniref:Uncharacterized protein n=1 Tax=Steinernema carpocapsae TaxID=34508 RepID=A0A4U5M251_STECR|nr:hypothetical protein L596_026711 [Steinernema carpocapsae]
MIFYSKPSYRNLKCYRIMIQIGIVHMLTVPTTITCGYGSLGCRKLLRKDVCYSSQSGSHLERGFGVKSPKNHLPVKVIMLPAYIYGLFILCVLMTPLAGYDMYLGVYLGEYNYTKPWTKLITTISLYTLIVVYLLSMR